MALVTGKFMSESWRIPEWQEEGTESSLRDSPVRNLVILFAKPNMKSQDDRPAAPLAAYATPTEKRTMQGFGNNTPVQSLMPDMLASNSASPSGIGSRWKDIDDFYAEDNTKQRVDKRDEEGEEEGEDEGGDEDEEDEAEEEESESEEEQASETDDHGNLLT
jgi:AP-3 complex subunit beta